MAGLAICIHLYSLHVALLMGDIKSGLLCSEENLLGCHSVASSSYSIILGLPLSAWGAIFYSALVVLGFGGVIFLRDCGWAFLRWSFFIVVFGLAFDIYLAFIMILKIKANCWLCVITYLINILIFIVLAIQLRREPRPRVSLKTIFPDRSDDQRFDHYYRNVIKGLLVGCIFISALAVVAGTQLLSQTLTENDRERVLQV